MDAVHEGGAFKDMTIEVHSKDVTIKVRQEDMAIEVQLKDMSNNRGACKDITMLEARSSSASFDLLSF